MPTFAAALEAVARSLARQQAADGEGATTLITCTVSGARDDVDARAVARAVVASSLVKAAVHGADPNWGRIAGRGRQRPPAAGARPRGRGPARRTRRAARAGQAVELDPDGLRIEIEGLPVFAGTPLPFDATDLRGRMRGGEVRIHLDLGAGSGVGEAFGCDLTEAYVVENSAYST